MLCTLTARRLTPGAFEEFHSVFEKAGEATPSEVMKRWKKVYVCRDVADEDVVLTFGLFDGTLEELREIQATAPPPASSEAATKLIADVLLDGSYEVLQEITP